MLGELVKIASCFLFCMHFLNIGVGTLSNGEISVTVTFDFEVETMIVELVEDPGMLFDD